MDKLTPTLKWIAVLLMPVVLGFGTIRAVINWDYPAWEYQRIAPDTYGWTPAERLELANVTLRYLQRPEPAADVIYLLEELRLPEDDTRPLYNDREIKHMLDVKIVADQLRNIFYITGVLVLGILAFFLVKEETRPLAAQVVYHGGIATVIVLAAIAAFILVGWSFFFVAFHELLFPPGTWTFSYSDALIRLFPERFWFDVGVLISVGTLLEGVLLAVIGRVWRGRYAA